MTSYQNYFYYWQVEDYPMIVCTQPVFLYSNISFTNRVARTKTDWLNVIGFESLENFNWFFYEMILYWVKHIAFIVRISQSIQYKLHFLIKKSNVKLINVTWTQYLGSLIGSKCVHLAYYYYCCWSVFHFKNRLSNQPQGPNLRVLEASKWLNPSRN